MRSKEFRREKEALRKVRTRKVAKTIFATENPSEEWIGKMSHTHCVPCSCIMCGNPRRHEKGKSKLTIQERRVSQ